MSEELTALMAQLRQRADDEKEVASADRDLMRRAASTIEAMKTSMHEVDGYCNVVRSNYRQGSQEEIISSTIKLKIREYLR